MDAPTIGQQLLSHPCDENAVLAFAKDIFEYRNGVRQLKVKEFGCQLLTCACAGVCVEVTADILAEDDETGDLKRIVKEYFRYLVNQGTNAGNEKARKFARLWQSDEAKVDEFIIRARQQQEIYDALHAKQAAERLVLEKLHREELALRVGILQGGQQLLDKPARQLEAAEQQEICDAREAELAAETLLLQAAEREELALPVRSDAAPDAAPDAACSHLHYLCQYRSEEDPM
jgi:hypothetical protein